MSNHDKLILVYTIATLLALTACGKGERFNGGGSEASPANILPSATVTVETPVTEVEQVVEAVTAAAETANVRVLEEVRDGQDTVITFEVPEVQLEKIVDALPKHCYDSKGKDDVKNKHCK
jgi:copper chaperone CopZ